MGKKHIKTKKNIIKRRTYEEYNKKGEYTMRYRQQGYTASIMLLCVYMHIVCLCKKRVQNAPRLIIIDTKLKKEKCIL
jgi:hypothetical protein